MRSASPSPSPTVSVGIPVYNGARYLACALDDVLAQSWRDFEVVVSDNASTDATPEILRRYAARDPRIRVLRQERNRGAAWNYNEVFRQSRGRYFRWAPADDGMAPEHLAACVAELEAHPGCVLVYPRTELIDARGRKIRDYADGLHLVQRWAWRRATAFVSRINLCNAVLGLYRSEVLARTGLIGSYVGSDAALLFETAWRGGIRELPEALLRRRVHDEASHEANPSPEARQRWLDPSQRASRRLSPRTRLLLEYQRIVWTRGEHGPGERALASLAVTSAWSLRRARVRLGLVRRRLLRLGPAADASDRWAGIE